MSVQKKRHKLERRIKNWMRRNKKTWARKLAEAMKKNLPGISEDIQKLANVAVGKLVSRISRWKIETEILEELNELLDKLNFSDEMKSEIKKDLIEFVANAAYEIRIHIARNISGDSFRKMIEELFEDVIEMFLEHIK